MFFCFLFFCFLFFRSTAEWVILSIYNLGGRLTFCLRRHVRVRPTSLRLLALTCPVQLSPGHRMCSTDLEDKMSLPDYKSPGKQSSPAILVRKNFFIDISWLTVCSVERQETSLLKTAAKISPYDRWTDAHLDFRQSEFICHLCHHLFTTTYVYVQTFIPWSFGRALVVYFASFFWFTGVWFHSNYFQETPHLAAETAAELYVATYTLQQEILIHPLKMTILKYDSYELSK